MVDVSGWYARSGIVEFPTISWAIEYDHLISGQAYTLVYHQVIYCRGLSNRLTCLAQICMAGVKNNEIPKVLVDDLYGKKHTIIVSDSLNPNHPMIIPLVLKGLKRYFTSRKPRASEYEDDSIPHINMTSDAPVWEPSQASLKSKNKGLMTSGDKLLDMKIYQVGKG